VDRRKSSGGVQTGSLNGTEPGDAGKMASRTLDDCCSIERNSDKTLLVRVEKEESQDG
jgi:hypothetical protein